MWNAHRAATYARQHALSSSQGRCAEFVTRAVRDGGGASLHNTHFARDMGSNLILAGFHQVYGEPIEGDIAVIQPTQNHPIGHACIYDGHRWISDFVQQHGMYPGQEYRTVRPSYAIYRHN